SIPTLKNEKEVKIALKTLFANLKNSVLLEVYSESIEIKFRKPSGTIFNFIFHEELNIDEIYSRLNKDFVTYL
ncbi:MAG: hypothetical protein AAFO78_14550, partial [Pseudomonadota bacterium]